MTWKIFYHELVYEKDRKEIDPYHWRLIINTIDKKLAVDPVHYGKPLHSELKGFYKLVADRYRVIYQIYKGEIKVWIVKIGPRKDDKVYMDFLIRKQKM